MTFSLVEGSTIYFIEGSGGKIKEAAESRKVEFGIAFPSDLWSSTTLSS